MTMRWNKAETLAAAEKASKLSDLLEQENLFKQNALRWLEHRHIEKFFKTIDAAESARLRHYAEALHYTGNETETRGFPLLDWLLVIGRAYGLERTYLETSASPGASRKLVARLAELEPDWVGRWLRWRRANGKGLRSNLTPVEDAVIDALTQSDLEPHLSVFKDEIVAAIIGRKPGFIEILPPERQGFLLRLALDRELQVSYVVEALSKHGIPSDAIAVIDGIFGSGNQAGVISQLDELVKEWQCVSGPDPVAVAITNGHERLDALLRSPWHTAHQSSGSRSDDNLWSPVLYGHIGRAFVLAARVAPDRFRLELGFSIGLRIAEAGEDPSPEKISEHLERVGIDKPAKMAHVLLPMVKLWAALRTLAKYQANSWEHETELVGLRGLCT